MKAIVTIAVSLAVLFSLCGCSSTAPTKNASVTAAGDAQTTTTEKTQAATTVATKKVNFTDYDGVWATSGYRMDKGGICLSLDVAGDLISVDCLQGGVSDTASVNVVVNAQTAVSNTISAAFSDSWGNRGMLKLTFEDAKILLSVSDVQQSDMANGEGMVEGDYTLTQDEVKTVYMIIGPLGDPAYCTDPEDPSTAFSDPTSLGAYEVIDVTDKYNYYDPSTDDNIDYGEPDTPTYDTSKASGILASKGMTEAEFRASCQELQTDYGSATGLNSEMLTELLEYPSRYAGGNYKFWSFTVESKSWSTDGYPCYEWDFSGYNMRIYDFRDDVYAPTISNGDDLTTYMVYQGIQTSDWGTDWLTFFLISCDKRR